MADDMVPEQGAELSKTVRDAVRRFVEDLDEKNRRRAAGLLALVLGRGGVATLGRVTGLSHTTIERGRGEVVAGTLGLRERVRGPGGGRKPLGKAPASSRRSKP